MGLFGDGRDGGYTYDDEYVSRIVENAEDDTVTADVLDASGSNRLLPGTGYLRDGPLLAYLDADEQPHYAFHNAEAGVITTSDGSRVTPDSNHRAVAVFTDRRFRVVVGRETGDREWAVANDDLVGLDVKNDNGRLVVETDDEGFVFDIDDPLDDDHLLDLVEFLVFHTAIEAWEFPDGWQRGIQRRRARRLGDRAEGTLDVDELEAILDPLDADEQPHYLLPASSVAVAHLENAYEPVDSVVVTDRRVLIDAEEATYDLTDYEADADATVETSIPYAEIDWVEGHSADGASGTLVVGRTWGPTCRVHVPESGADEAADAVRYVQRQVLTSRLDYDDADPLEWIERLGKLNRAGYLDDEEFEAQKRSLLERPRP